MAETQTPQKGTIKEGDFFFVAGYGLAMAHYPMRDKKSRFYEDPRPKGKARAQAKASDSKMDRNSLMLVSLLPTQKPMLHDPKTEGVLFPIPSVEELDEAVLITSQREPETELTDELYAELADSGKLSDIARIGRIVAGKPNTAETKAIFKRSVDIIGSVHFYHSVIAADPKKTRILTAKTATSRFSDTYYDCFEELLAKGKALTAELETSGTMNVEFKEDAVEKPENGTLHYLLGKGVVVAHYPAQSSKSLYAGKGEALLVSLVPGAGSSPMSDKNLADLRPIPSLEDMDKALVEANKSPPQTLFTDQNYFDGLLKSENLHDVAKAGSFANKDPNNPIFSRAAVNSFSIMTGIDLYHRELAGKTPESVTKLITTKARNDQHKRKYAVSAERVINRAAEILNGLVNIGQASADTTFIDDTADAVRTHQDGGKRVAADTAKAKDSPADAKTKTADQPANPDEKPLSKKAARRLARAQAKADKKANQPKAEPVKISKEQLALVEAAKKYAQEKRANNEAAETLTSLFKVGKLGFKETVAALRHTFAEPMAAPPRRDLESGKMIRPASKATQDDIGAIQETADILNTDDPDANADIAEVIALAKRANRRIKGIFAKNHDATPEAATAVTNVIDGWRPLEY